MVDKRDLVVGFERSRVRSNHQRTKTTSKKGQEGGEKPLGEQMRIPLKAGGKSKVVVIQNCVFNVSLMAES